MPRGDKKLAGKPKRAMTAYAYFVQTVREEYRTQKPDEQLSFGDLSRQCSVRWKSLTDEEKRHFDELANRDKKRFEQDMNEFNAKANFLGELKQEGDARPLGNGMPPGSSMRAELDADSVDDDDVDGFDPTRFGSVKTDIDSKKGLDNQLHDASTSASGKKRKRKHKKDPNAPKRNISAFFFFCEESRPSVRVEHPEWRVGDISKELSRRWEQLTDKSKYEARARSDKERYESQINEYHRVKKEQEAADLVRQREADSQASMQTQHQPQTHLPSGSQQSNASNGKSTKKKKASDGPQPNVPVGAVQQPATCLTEMQPAIAVQQQGANTWNNCWQQPTMFHNATMPAGTIMQTMPNSQMAVLNVQMLPGQSHFQVIPFAGQPMTQMNVSMTQPGTAMAPPRPTMQSNAPANNMMNAAQQNNMMAPGPPGGGQSGMSMGGMQTGLQVQVQGAPMQVNGPLPVGAPPGGSFMPPLYTGMSGPGGMQMVGVPLQFVTAPPTMMSHDGTAFMQIPIQPMHYIPAQHGMQFMPPGVNMGVGVGQQSQVPGMVTHVGMMAPNGATLQSLEPMQASAGGPAPNQNVVAPTNGGE